MALGPCLSRDIQITAINDVNLWHGCPAGVDSPASPLGKLRGKPCASTLPVLDRNDASLRQLLAKNGKSEVLGMTGLDGDEPTPGGIHSLVLPRLGCFT